MTTSRWLRAITLIFLLITFPSGLSAKDITVHVKNFPPAYPFFRANKDSSIQVCLSAAKYMKERGFVIVSKSKNPMFLLNIYCIKEKDTGNNYVIHSLELFSDTGYNIAIDDDIFECRQIDDDTCGKWVADRLKTAVISIGLRRMPS